VVPPSGAQFVVGDAEVPQQVPRAEIAAGTPRDVTFAPRVTVVWATDEEVGVVTVGATLAVHEFELILHVLFEQE